MALYSLDAIEIYTDDGTGALVSYTNTAIGCSGGVFRICTGRPTISSASGDTSATTWYTGILADSGITCTRSARFESAGAMADASGLDFRVVNTSQFWKTLEDNDIHLNRCRIVYYYATSANNAAWTFYKRWSGIIDDQPFGELAYNVKCIDTSKDLFRTIPPRVVDSTAFPLAPKESLDKVIPVSIGRVATSPAVNVNQSGTKIGLCVVDGVTRKVAGCQNYVDGTTPFVTLYTKGIYFLDNDARLVGSYITVIKGGAKQSRIIVGNVHTTTTEPYYTMMYLNEEFDVSTAFTAWDSGSASADVWYAEVGKYNASLITSLNPVYSMWSGTTGVTVIHQYSSEAKKYTDISEIGESSSLTNISYSGSPGIKIASSNELLSGDLTIYRRIKPSDVVLANTNNTTNVTYSVGDSMPNVIDRSRASVAQFTRATGSTANIYLDVYLPFGEISGEFEELYLLFDMFEDTITTFTSVVNLGVTVFDIYGREANLSPAISINDFQSTSLTAAGRNSFLIPFEYYGDAPSVNEQFNDSRASLDISSCIEDIKAGLAYERVRLCFEFESSGISTTHTIEIREVLLVAKTNIAYTNEPLYVHQVGEIFESTWNGRRTAAQPVELVGDAIEKIIRNYDYNYPTWEASRVYVVGDYVRNGADDGHYYRCTVAGTSGSAEPTWGATVTDNTVTWVDDGEFAIDEAAFDTLRTTTRADWYIGRTLEKQSDSEQVIRELAEQAYIGIQTKSNGDITATAFLENATPLVAFDESNSWDLSEVTMTPQRSVYNELLINYAFDYGEKKFKKQLFVTNVDRPSFPGIYEVATRGTNLGSFTATLIFSEDSRHLYSVVTSSPHGVLSGDYVSIEGNADGYNIPPTIASVVDDLNFHVEGQWSPTAVSTSGAIYHNPSTALKWKSYVGGVNSYSRARSLWNRCHESFLVTKTVQKMPEDLSNCHWFIDVRAEDLYGNYIWPDLEGDVDDHAAYYFAVDMARWGAWQKKQISFSVDRSAANMALMLFDCVSIADAKTTNSVALVAYISEIHDTPGSGKEKESLRLSVVCSPEFAPENVTRIIDTSDDTDRIIDTSDDTDRIIDTPT